MKNFGKMFKKAFVVTIAMLLICGFIYPFALTGLGQLFFKEQANGSIIKVNGKEVGAKFVGQQFTDDRFFKGRPSQYNYNTYTEDGYYAGKEKEEGNEYAGLSSGSANYGNSNPALKERVEADIEAFRESHPDVDVEDIPGDLLTASGSGLDPHITVASAEIQVPAVSEASGLSEEELKEIIKDNTTGKVLGVFGEETVNVLECNIAIAEKLGILED